MRNDYNIDELAKFICMGKHSDLPCHEECKKKCEFRERAKAISDAGYKKQIWHKVADHDFPPANTDVICFEKLKGTGQKVYDLCVYSYVENCWYGFGFMADEIDEVIAWTELPLYEE